MLPRCHRWPQPQTQPWCWQIRSGMLPWPSMGLMRNQWSYEMKKIQQVKIVKAKRLSKCFVGSFNEFKMIWRCSRVLDGIGISWTPDTHHRHQVKASWLRHLRSCMWGKSDMTTGFATSSKPKVITVLCGLGLREWSGQHHHKHNTHLSAGHCASRLLKKHKVSPRTQKTNQTHASRYLM